MKIETPEQIPVIPPQPWLVASEKQFKASEVGLHSLGTNEIGAADLAWQQHKQEHNLKLNIVAFGKPEGPGDKLRPYAVALRAKRQHNIT